MSIPKGHRMNLDTIIRAAKNGDLCLIECQERKTKKIVYILAAASSAEIEGEVDLVPLARMFEGNPYKELIPPGVGDQEG